MNPTNRKAMIEALDRAIARGASVSLYIHTKGENDCIDIDLPFAKDTDLRSRPLSSGLAGWSYDIPTNEYSTTEVAIFTSQEEARTEAEHVPAPGDLGVRPNADVHRHYSGERFDVV